MEGGRDQSSMLARHTGGTMSREKQLVGNGGSQRGGGGGQANFINEEMSDEQRETARPSSA